MDGWRIALPLHVHIEFRIISQRKELRALIRDSSRNGYTG
jgi:hypothetical protein